jgi:transcriptional regulator with XRE-family HTH domain
MSYEGLSVGRRIRDERRRQSVTLQELARRVGLSTGRLSQIENGQQVPNVRDLFAVAEALGLSSESLIPPDVSLPYLIRRESEVRASPPREAHVSARDGKRQLLPNVYWPLAELFVGRQLEPFLAQIRPVADDKLQFLYHHEHQFVFILKGVIEFLVKTPRGLCREELHRGDCIYFRSNLPHCVRSLLAEPAESLHVLSSSSSPMPTGWDWMSPQAIAYVDDGTGDIADLVGMQLNALRGAHGWSITDVARLVHMKERHLEQIERGERAVPLDALMRLARVFGKSLPELIRGTDSQEPDYVIQRSDLSLLRPRKLRSPIDQLIGPPQRLFYPLAESFPARNMFPFLVRMLNANTDGESRHEHHGQEFIYVLDGELELTTYAGEKEVKETLNAGDSCYIDSSVPHLFQGHTRNPYSDTSADVIDVFWCPLGRGYLFDDPSTPIGWDAASPASSFQSGVVVN